MPIKFHVGQDALSNKPPEPNPTPSEEDFPTTLTLKDGRTVWVSVPQPDRLTIVGELGAHTYTAKVPAEIAPVTFLKQFGDYLLEGPHNAHQVDFWFDPAKGYYRSVTLALGPRGSRVFFQPMPPKDGHGWRMRIEMNPRKLGKSGMVQLAKVLGGKSAPLKLPEFVSTCRVNRIDVAVDFVGVGVDDLLVAHKKQGKRSYYVGPDGVLETVLVHRKLTPPKAKKDKFGDDQKLSHRSKPAGAVLLKVYDRARERQAVLQPPPFGPAAVSRVEVTLSRLQTYAPLSKLALLPDPFAGATVSVWSEQPVSSDVLWGEYVSLRRSTSAAKAQTTLGISDTRANAFEAALAAPPVVVSSTAIWEAWAASLKATGLGAWIAL